MSIVDRGIIERVKKARPTSVLIICVHFSMRQIYLTESSIQCDCRLCDRDDDKDDKGHVEHAVDS